MPKEFKSFTKSKKLVIGRARGTASAFIPVHCLPPPDNVIYLFVYTLSYLLVCLYCLCLFVCLYSVLYISITFPLDIPLFPM